MSKDRPPDKPLDDEQRAKLAALRAALIEGENSGTAKSLDFDAFIAKKNRSRRKSANSRG